MCIRDSYNDGDADADISGWTITDSDPTHVFIVPAGTIVAPGGVVVFDNGVGPGMFDFGLSTSADEVHVYDAGSSRSTAPAGSQAKRTPARPGGASRTAPARSRRSRRRRAR